MATQVPSSFGSEIGSLLNWTSAVIKRMNRADSKVKYLTLFGYTTGAGARYATFRKFGDAAGYTPPSGKVFIALAAKGRFNINNTTTLLVFGSGNDVGFNTGSAPTGTDAADATHGIRLAYETASQTFEPEMPCLMRITAGRYISLLSNGAGSSTVALTMIGFEIDPSISSLEET